MTELKKQSQICLFQFFFFRVLGTDADANDLLILKMISLLKMLAALEILLCQSWKIGPYVEVP